MHRSLLHAVCVSQTDWAYSLQTFRPQTDLQAFSHMQSWSAV